MTVRVWHWPVDAELRVGGQAAVIHPELDRADVAIFLFKHRVGVVTWQELDRARARNNLPILAFFSANEPAECMDDEVVVEAWLDLIKKKKQLTKDWSAPGSQSLTPTHAYRDVQHFKDQLVERMNPILAELVGARTKRGIGPDVSPAPEPDDRYESLHHDRRPVIGKSLAQLDDGLVQRFLAAPLSKDRSGPILLRSPREQLEALGYARDDMPTFGAFLCLGRSEALSDYSGGCELQLVSYDGTKSGDAKARIQVARDNLVSLFTAGLDWLERQSGLRRRGNVGSRNRDELEIPPLVLREALANALVHRDYEDRALSEQPTRVEVYTDRVEITSFGRLPKQVPVALLNAGAEAIPFRRNPVIAQIFQSLGHVELNASGVQRMRAEMERVGLPPPKFAENLPRSVVRVILLRPSEWADKGAFEREIRPASSGTLTGPADSAGRPSPSAGARAPVRVFISSTGDLPEHRRAVLEACLHAGVLPVVWDSSAVKAESTEDTLSRVMADADLYVVIVAHRYGSILPGSEVSFVEAEYDAARALGIPVLAFLISEDHPVPMSSLERDDAARDKLEAFKRRLLTNHVETFGSPADLQARFAASMLQAVQSLKSRPIKPRWPPGIHHALPDVAKFVGREEQLAKLSDWLRAEPSALRVLAVVGLGGMGKSALVARALADFYGTQPAGLFVWSFYENPGVDAFAQAACAYFGRLPLGEGAVPFEVLRTLFAGMEQHLLILDGVEQMLQADEEGNPRFRELQLGRLLEWLAYGVGTNTRALITSRQTPADLKERSGYRELALSSMTLSESIDFLPSTVGLPEREMVARQLGGYPLLMSIAARYLETFGLTAIKDSPFESLWPQVLRRLTIDLDESDRRLLHLIATSDGRRPIDEFGRELMMSRAQLYRSLTNLMARGLVTTRAQEGHGNPRVIHELLRELFLKDPSLRDSKA